jgi:hypothetical protein
MAVRPKELVFLQRLNTGFTVSPLEHVCMTAFSNAVLSCVGRDLETGRSLV